MPARGGACLPRKRFHSLNCQTPGTAEDSLDEADQKGHTGHCRAGPTFGPLVKLNPPVKTLNMDTGVTLPDPPTHTLCLDVYCEQGAESRWRWWSELVSDLTDSGNTLPAPHPSAKEIRSPGGQGLGLRPSFFPGLGM